MKIRVLGSAAGGGFPQWNCNCHNCSGLRRGTVRATPRTQSSIAVAAHAADAWVLVNASPDLPAQLRANPQLQPARARRDSAIAAVVLVDAQVDHTAGLYMLRESNQPLAIWCTDSVHADLTGGNPIFTVLGHYCGVARRRIDSDGAEFTVDGLPDLRWCALAVPGKAPPYSPHRNAPLRGDNVALTVSDAASGGTLVYAPGLAAMEPSLWKALQSADCVLIDGTFWSEEEMITQGVSPKRARDLGHLPLSGEGGMLEWLTKLPRTTRRILVHVNNTNPILDEDSAERAALGRAGVEVACDGLEISL
ncbi:MAG TPA: pyrroloquinoline quinone biosynthesis protein PqqB [Steroidobacteraceae bacterium]|nr:pyrroloquinoline quinone biosynthesis protein PqqB [Steroidobacteraceae bacterium]